MYEPLIVRSGFPFNYDADEVSAVTGLDCDGSESVTQQQFKDECDINTIVRRFGLTGELPDDVRMPMSGDFTDAPDFDTAMQLVVQAKEEFMRLPAELRSRFNNDPGRLIAFIEDDGNRDEARKLGLLKPEPEKARDGGSVPPPQAAANL